MSSRNVQLHGWLVLSFRPNKALEPAALPCVEGVRLIDLLVDRLSSCRPPFGMTFKMLQRVLVFVGLLLVALYLLTDATVGDLLPAWPPRVGW